jgi:hypothetical protein
MTRMLARYQPRGRLAATLRRLVAVVLGIAALSGCFDPKTRTFFDPFTGRDITPPAITFLAPMGVFLNSDDVCFRVTDDFDFDPEEIEAGNLVVYPVRPLVNLGEFAADISAGGPGPHTIRVEVPDLAGNLGIATTNIIKDEDDPAVNNFTLPANQSSSAASLSLSLGYRISDASIRNISRFSLFTAGTDNECGTGDDQAVPQGTSGGQANPASQDVTGTGTGTTRDFTANFTLFNGAPPGMTVVRRFCGRVEAFDQAKNCTNQDNPNSMTATSNPFIVEWIGAAPTTGTLTVTVRVSGQVQQGAQVQITGPGGSATATTDASGIARFENRQPGANNITTTLAGHVCPSATGTVVAGQTTNVDVNCTPQPQDFTVTFNQPGDFYIHIGPGNTNVCGRGGTNPAQPGAAYTITWSGPGIVGGNTRSGTLDATGSFFDRQSINLFGMYIENVSVTSGGLTRSGTATKTVTAVQGSCPAPSSSRFKRGIVGLLPEGVTVLGLRPVAFRYVEPYGDPTVPQIGLIAEEVVRVYPEAVALDAAGRPEGIYYGVLTGQVIGELETRVQRAVTAGIARLESAL